MLNLIGKRFGRLTAIEPTEEWTNQKKVIWVCICDCGNLCKVSRCNLRSGSTKSCGCLWREVASEKAKHMQPLGAAAVTTHGHARHGHLSHEYFSYTAAKRRCQNPNAANYAYYGGRGIAFIFQSFEEFYAELGPRPEPKELYSIERINNDSHYMPGNVRWATSAEQAANRRPTAVA